jgi:hypothetical protein
MTTDDTAGPVHLIEDGDTGDRLIVYATERGTKVDLRVESETFWATQAQMAAMFGVSVSAVSKHLTNIFADGELHEDSVVAIKAITAADGKPYRTRLYNLNAVISVGYRIESKQGTMFRIWATDKLVQYMTKGFVIDDERLKNPDGQPDYFDELLERIRDIRASEKRMWTRVLEFAAFCSDYEPGNGFQAAEFFGEIQNTMHWAVLQMTAPELVKSRVDARKEHAGVVHFKGQTPTVEEAKVAKNLLQEPEIKALNHITTLVLEFFESQVEQRRLTTLPEFLSKMRELVRLDGRPLKRPGYAGTVSRPMADRWASEQIRDYKARKRIDAEAAGEKELKKIAASVQALPKPKPKRERKPKAKAGNET